MDGYARLTFEVTTIMLRGCQIGKDLVSIIPRVCIRFLCYLLMVLHILSVASFLFVSCSTDGGEHMNMNGKTNEDFHIPREDFQFLGVFAVRDEIFRFSQFIIYDGIELHPLAKLVKMLHD